MRLGLWNLQRGGRHGAAYGRQVRLLDTLNLDIAVLTEPPAKALTTTGDVVASPAQRVGAAGAEAWVAVVGHGVQPVPPAHPFERLAVAARYSAGGRSVIIYGCVLPWRTARTQAPELALTGESAGGMFARVLSDQKRDVESLVADHPDALVLWVGDFNQSLAGPNVVGSNRGRGGLNNALDDLGFEAWNANAPHACADLHTIDLICGPSAQPLHRVGRVDPMVDGRRLSDHAAYWVELDVG